MTHLGCGDSHRLGVVLMNGEFARMVAALNEATPAFLLERM